MIIKQFITTKKDKLENVRPCILFCQNRRVQFAGQKQDFEQRKPGQISAQFVQSKGKVVMTDFYLGNVEAKRPSCMHKIYGVTSS